MQAAVRIAWTGTSVHTVRTQIKSVFAKCGSHRQADVVRDVYRAALLGLAVACTPNTAKERSAERAQINANATAALNELYSQNQAARTLSRNADGILVFPSIVKGGLVVGAETGDGVLLVGGDPIAYYNTSAVSVGLQAGAQSYSQVLMFMTADALSRFRNSAGFEIGVDGEVTVIDAGVNAEVDTSNLQTDIVAFLFGFEGLMGGDSTLRDPEARKRELARDLEAGDGAPVIEPHPNIAELYARKTGELRTLLKDETARPQAMEIVRSLIDRIEVRAAAKRGQPEVTLVGALAAVGS